MPAPTYRTIYLLCPAKVRTGGPEALHQLGRSLRDLGHDARMVYASPDAEPEVRQGRLRFAEIADPRPDAYAHYRLPYTFEIEDDAANALVFPEVWPRILRSINNISPYMWWLSIDNGLGAFAIMVGLPRSARCAASTCASHIMHCLICLNETSPVFHCSTILHGNILNPRLGPNAWIGSCIPLGADGSPGGCADGRQICHGRKSLASAPPRCGSSF